MAALIALWCVSLLYSLYVGYFNELLALTVFFLLIFITAQVSPESLDEIVWFYKYAVLFTAFGVLVQFLVHRLLGVELFRYQLLGGGRNAYSFIWEDYSFIALFIVSGVPLFFERVIGSKFLFFACFLLLSSVITSARTGVVAFVLFVIIYVGVEMFKALLTWKIKKIILVVFVLMLILPVFLIIAMEHLTGRQVTGSSSGRIDDFVLGLSYLKENILFGFYFDKVAYNDSVSIIPHNAFVYMLYMGGVTAFSIFILWFSLVIINLRFSDKRLVGALLVCLLGFQFIPSFFSAYFLAVLLGAAFVSDRHNRNKLAL
ncbi:hypothetical protein [Phytopseudomonas dryadis]|uniref:hypothetical protein n=1 Tax=Pseudomonadaceae TaxID=135621 RepID=UPI0010373C04|nr:MULTISPECIES: hypothetical protein [Pseudomonas]